MDIVELWTDGSCNSNTRQGGWGAVLVCREQKRLLRGKESNTTCNRMEMQAVLSGLEALQRKCSVTVYTDSMIVYNGCMALVRENSKTKANLDLWQQIWNILPQHEWEVEWIPGHSGILNNELADQLACYHAN